MNIKIITCESGDWNIEEDNVAKKIYKARKSINNYFFRRED